MPDDQERLEIVPLYDQVRKDIYDAFTLLANYRKNILYDLAEGYTPKNMRKYKAELVAFYGFVCTKVSYPKATKYLKLKELSKFVSDPDRMTVNEAEEFYTLFAELIERLGITRIGRASMSDPTNAPFEKTEK